MKVAILFSGQPRFYDRLSYVQHKKRLLDVYDCDVFCHFWWSLTGGEYQTAPWSGLGALPMERDVDVKISELYRPKAMLHEPPPPESIVSAEYPATCTSDTPYNLHSMYLSMKKSYELMAEYATLHGVTYDVVIRTRYDNVFTSFPDLKLLAKDKMYFVHRCEEVRPVITNECVIFVGVAWVKEFMHIYDKIRDIYVKTGYLNDEMNVHTYMKTLNVKREDMVFLALSQFDLFLDRSGLR